MTEHKLNFTLTLRAPFITKGTGAMAFGLDTFALKHNEKLVIPGRLIKGMLKEKCEQFAEITQDKELNTLIDDLFGKSFEDEATQGRGSLIFPWRLTDTTTKGTEQESKKRFRIKIDDETGVVKKGHLQIIETEYETGTEVIFKGEGWYTHQGEPEQLQKVQALIEKATSQIKALGAFKTVGFGQVVSFNIEFEKVEQKKAQRLTQHKEADQVLWPISISFDRPVCFAAPRKKMQNHFEASTIISGNIIKAGIANRLADYNQDHALRKYFDDIIVRHGIPAKAETPTRNQSLPLSLAKIADKQHANLAQINEAIIFKKGGKYLAPVFESDWKPSDEPSDETRSIFTNVDYWPQTTTTIHTAVNTESGTAEEGQLYSLEVVENEPTVWLSEIALPTELDISEGEIEQISEALSSIFTLGVPNMGKTKARMTAKSGEYNPKAPLQLQSDQLITIKLESNALMFSATELVEEKGNLHNLYQDYFTSLVSEEAMELHSFYCDQRLGGGEYYFHHFAKGKASKETPLINYLTTNGSVFTFKIKNTEKANKCLTQWLANGLPLPESLHALDWETTPYIPQNGFGEISIMSNEQARYNLDKIEYETIAQGGK